MKTKKQYVVFGYTFLSLLICLVIVVSGVWEYHQQVQVRKKGAENVLLYQQENMELQLRKNMRYMQALTPFLEGDVVDKENFYAAAVKMAEEAEIRYIGVFEGHVLTYAFPRERFSGDIGQMAHDFPFVYSMGKIPDAFFVEGPLKLHRTNEDVFLFFKPIWKAEKYWGQVVVAIDKAYVLEQLNLDVLRAQGYAYELWNVDVQDGSKKVVAMSDSAFDFSPGMRVSSYLPTQWTLTVYPADGWVSRREMIRLVINSVLVAGLLIGLLLLWSKVEQQKKRNKMLLSLDHQTALYNRGGFVKKLDEWLKDDSVSLTLFYFVIHDFNRVSQMVAEKEMDDFLAQTAEFMGKYAISKHLLGRVGECNFVLAIKETLTKEEAQDIGKGLALEIFWRVKIEEEKIFLNTGYQYVQFPTDGKDAAELLKNVVKFYYHKVLQESPVHELTENCLKLLKGEANLVFNQYTDPEMMRLSKAINQYRKQAEQLAYRDPVLDIGNRLCYLRDARLWISYDAKRAFTLYCIDICSFSRFNELFSVDTGDAVLAEVAKRLSALFGNHLYRISGDVFLGLWMGDVLPADRISIILREPIIIEELRFSLNVKIGICDYPSQARTPEKLLEGVQVALHHAKQTTDQMAAVYNHVLADALHRESHILQLLEENLARQTLEVWFQPIANIGERRFTAMEALLRLKDDTGRYLPTDEVIAIAERNCIMDQVGGYVLRQACLVMKNLAVSEDFRLNINLSIQQLMIEGCVEGILLQIRSTGIDFSRISLEVKENVLIQSFEKAEEILSQLQKTGMYIALDDFGTGHSSLSHLANLPVDVLKIDRQLTGKIMDSPQQYALLKAILEMTKANGIQVVVEGVETVEERDLVVEAGVNLIQGYYYARPMTGFALTEILKKKFID